MHHFSVPVMEGQYQTASSWWIVLISVAFFFAVLILSRPPAIPQPPSRNDCAPLTGFSGSNRGSGTPGGMLDASLREARAQAVVTPAVRLRLNSARRTRARANSVAPARSESPCPAAATVPISTPRSSFFIKNPSPTSLNSSAVASPASPDQEPPQPGNNTARTAKDASRLLRRFSRIFPHDNSTTPESVFNDAFAKLLSIQKQYRLKAAQENEPLSPLEMELKELNIDASCIICYTRIADTVVIPCGHLSICSVGSPLVGFSGQLLMVL